METSSYKTFTEISHRSQSSIEKLIAKVNRLCLLNQRLYESLDPALHKHCQTADMEGETLTLVADTPAWAARIRYSVPDLIEKLQKEPEFHELKKITCIIQPENHPKIIKKQPLPSLSNNTIALINETAKNIDDPTLQKALLKLCSHKTTVQ
jgi:hypothetical protein